MLLSCLYLFGVRMLRSQRDSLTSAVIFMSLLAVSQRSTDIWVRPGESWIHWITGCGASVPVREDEILSLQVLGASSLALWMRDFDSDQGAEMDIYIYISGV